jgi:23S rRNA pseudouridine955/2504/2580 synthase
MAGGKVKRDSKVRMVEAEADDAGQRIDNFLQRHLRGVPKGLLYRLMRTGQVRVNSGRIKPHYRMRAGDQVRIPPLESRAERRPAPAPESLGRELERRILHEDERLLILDKPAGVAVHGGSGLAWGLIDALRAARPEDHFLELAHRLDRDTSGCLIIARRRSTLRRLHAMLREGRIEKRYLALVAGEWAGGRREVNQPLHRTPAEGRRRQVVVSEEGRAARTLFRPAARYRGWTLMEARLDTGRTHQIRVHAAHLGHPLAGDERYGQRELDRELKAAGLRRMFLHAASVALEHPETGGRLAVSAPLDPALQALLERLEALE